MCSSDLNEASKLGRARRVDDAAGRYVEFCKSTVPGDFDLRGMKIVVDCAHGAAYHVAPPVLHELGAEVVTLGVSPDGYNICVIYHSTLSFNPLLFSNLPYNAETDFVPVARLFFLVEGLFASSESNVKTVAEAKALAQSKPDGLNYATLGEGSYPELFLKWLNNQWNTQILGVPYRGGGPAAQALAANQVQLTRFGVGNFVGVIEAGKVRALAVTSDKRSPVLPNVPTFKEVGWGDYPGQGWWGLAAPKGTPKEIVAKLSTEFQKLFSEPKFVEFLDKQAVVAAPTSPEGFAEFLKKDRKDAETLIKIANTKKTEFKE